MVRILANELANHGGRWPLVKQAWLCIECREEVGGDFVHTAVQVNLGKDHGGVSIKKKRRTLKPKTA